MDKYLEKIKEITQMWDDGLVWDQEAIMMIVLAGAELCENITINDDVIEG